MSHWQAGKVGMKCTLGVLQRALLNIMPQWKEYIKVDPSGGLTIYDMSGVAEEGYQLMIPKNAPGMRYCDLGFKMAEDGGWSVTIDPIGVPKELSNIENAVKGEVARMRAKAVAISKGLQHTERVTADSYVIEIIKPVEA